MKLIPLLFLATVCLGDPALDRPLAGTVKEIRKNPIDDSEFSYVIVWNEDKKPRWDIVETLDEEALEEIEDIVWKKDEADSSEIRTKLYHYLKD